MKNEMSSVLERNRNKKDVVKLVCFPGPCRTGENGVSRFFVSDGWSSVRNKIGRCRIKCGKTPNLMGFTLIELLVVVLIIGILASVALPQYKRVVLKAKLTQMLVYMDALKKGAEMYYMANGEYPNDVTALDIDISGTAVTLGQSTRITGETTVAATFSDGTECVVTSALSGCINDDFYLLRFHDHSTERNMPHGIFCQGRGTGTDSAKVCALVSNEAGRDLDESGRLYYLVGN